MARGALAGWRRERGAGRGGHSRHTLPGRAAAAPQHLCHRQSRLQAGGACGVRHRHTPLPSALVRRHCHLHAGAAGSTPARRRRTQGIRPALPTLSPRPLPVPWTPDVLFYNRGTSLLSYFSPTTTIAIARRSCPRRWCRGAACSAESAWTCRCAVHQGGMARGGWSRTVSGADMPARGAARVVRCLMCAATGGLPPVLPEGGGHGSASGEGGLPVGPPERLGPAGAHPAALYPPLTPHASPPASNPSCRNLVGAPAGPGRARAQRGAVRRPHAGYQLPRRLWQPGMR